jgi:phosphate starvation-inducible PhoH-like protein
LTKQNALRKITLQDNREAALLFGIHDAHLKRIEEQFPAKIVARGGDIVISGDSRDVETLERLFSVLLQLVRKGHVLTEPDVGYAIEVARRGQPESLLDLYGEQLGVTAKGKTIRAKTFGQRAYVEAIRRHDIVFGIGPAGTGKTYLAVVMAVQALRRGEVKRIVLTRPAVEAGENLGFLPGDLQEKVDPYLRPLYDALYDVFGADQVHKALERGMIEIAPLAYMRGRTLEESFVILDEAQNATGEQMKMFLTRLGLGSKMVITGDVTQVDLPKGKRSGLKEAAEILGGIAEIAFVYLTGTDVVRHPLVQKIISAYQAAEDREEPRNAAGNGTAPPIKRGD